MFVGDTVRLYSETEVGYEVIEGNGLVSEIAGPSIVGRWESGDSYTVFNEDGTGSLVIYLNGSPV